MKTHLRPLSFLTVVATAMMAWPLARGEEPANPESEPLKDRSTKASPRSDRLIDKTRRASDESRPVEDDGPAAGDQDRVRPAGKDAQPAGKDAQPVKDDDSKANERSQPEVDRSKNANPESRKTDDSTPRKASPDAQKKRDATTEKADPYADKVEDTHHEKASPDARHTSPDDRRRTAERGDTQPVDELSPREAAVVRAHEELARDLKQRKIQLQGREDANRLMTDILGKDSRLSRAELNRLDQSEVLRTEREDRRAAAEFLRKRLRGQADLRDMPPFFRTPAPAEAAAGEPVMPEPFFIHDGRRFVFYPSRDEIPAVLFANATLERVSIMPAAELNGAVFGERIPVEFRSGEPWVVSYPVVTSSIVTTHDILFREDSTEFADGHSYDMVLALTEAMLGSELAGARFAIEGHASAEGTSVDNQLLSQLRAEAIVRELVRGGVAPDRLIPVGYGESESHHPADAAENLLRQDRRVVVSRIDSPADR